MTSAFLTAGVDDLPLAIAESLLIRQALYGLLFHRPSKVLRGISTSMSLRLCCPPHTR